MNYYIVTLIRGGSYRIEAESADDARQQVTHDYQERVNSVALDNDQSFDTRDDC